MKLTYLSVLAGSSVLALSSAALAQGAPATNAASANNVDNVSSGDIIVQARRRDEALQDVPLVVNAVSSEQIAKLNIRTFNEVATLVPGLQLAVEPNGISGSGQLRGISYNGNTGANASVTFYQNDAPIEASNLLQTMYDVADIEVLRGPQGTLRGEASPSGSITVTTKKPDLYRVGAYASVTANDIGTQNVNAAIGIPIVEGIAAIRVAGLIQEDDGNRVKSVAPSGDLRDPYGITKSGRASLLVTPADWLKFQVVYQHTDHKVRGFDQYVSYNLIDPATPINPVQPTGNRRITASDRQSIQATPNQLRQIYNVYNWRAEASHWGQSLIYQGARSIADFFALTNQDTGNFLPTRDFYQNTRTHSKQTTHEIRLQNDDRVADIFDYVVGFYSVDLLATTNLTQQTPVLLPAAFGGGVATVANTPITVAALGANTQRAEFGNITAHLGSSTEISGGLRHIASVSAGRVLTIAGNPILNPEKRDKGWIYSASIKHNFGDDLMVYANTGTSRRPGPATIGDFSVQQSALERAFTDLPTETSRSYELGFKSSWLDKRLRFNMTAYHQTFENYAYYNNSGTYFVNYGATVTGGVVTITPSVQLQRAFVAPVPVTVNGLEGELSFDVSRQWNVGITGSYSLGKIKNGLVPCTDINGDGIPDQSSVPPTLAQLQAAAGANNLSTCRVTQRSSNQPLLSATVTSEYNHPVSGNTDAFVRGLLSLYGNSQGDPVYAFDSYKGYGLLNVFAGVRDAKGQWELSIFAKNVTGVTRATTIFNGGPAQTAYQRLSTSFVASGQTYASNYAQVQTNSPREFGATFRIAFGAR